MTRHCVPYATGLKLCHTHNELTALNLSGKDVFTNCTMVSILKATKLNLIGILNDYNAFFRCAFRLDKYCRICLMSRCTVEIELCRRCRVKALERNIL